MLTMWHFLIQIDIGISEMAERTLTSVDEPYNPKGLLRQINVASYHKRVGVHG